MKKAEICLWESCKPVNHIFRLRGSVPVAFIVKRLAETTFGSS